MTIFEGIGSLAPESNNQRLSIRSSIEAMLIASDDFLPTNLRTFKFMDGTGNNINTKLYQYNMSAMMLETKGCSFLGK